MDCTDSEIIPFLAEQRVFARYSDHDRTSDVLERLNDGEESRIFVGLVTAEKCPPPAFAVGCERRSDFV